MTGHVATCWQSFKIDMDAYNGHVRLLTKVWVISRMSKNRPCLTKGIRVGEKAPSKNTLLLDSLK